LVITSGETVRDLNREYRGLDEETDVLSFSPLHWGQWEGETAQDGKEANALDDPGFVYPPNEPTPLGEVVISFPQAQRQALERSEPLDREMALLIVHGILHLVGHDHAEPEEESAMKAKEQTALNIIPRLLIPGLEALRSGKLPLSVDSTRTVSSKSESEDDEQPRTVRL
jgi:probable rRNA maturation factor